MAETHELLPPAWRLTVPDAVQATLLDLGVACNEAALALNQAHLLYRCSVHGCEAAEAAQACGQPACHRREYARRWVDCTVSYLDQVTAVYTVITARFAAYAASLGLALATAGSFPTPAPDPAGVRPSHVLGEPASYVPLVQLPPGRGGDPIATHNDELAAQHRRVLAEVDAVVGSLPMHVYDDPLGVASRPAESMELSGNLADALHAYAAACVWGIGLATRIGPTGAAPGAAGALGAPGAPGTSRPAGPPGPPAPGVRPDPARNHDQLTG